MAYFPVDPANEALDAIGSRTVIGDLEEGSREAQVLLRKYGQALRQMLRCAHWNFARKEAPLQLLADRTGRTPGVGTQVIEPWRYEYQYPIDCMKLRFIPHRHHGLGSAAPGLNPAGGQVGNPALAQAVGGSYAVQGINTIGSESLRHRRLVPTRFLEATDYNYPPQSQTEWWEVQGVSPVSRTVVCSNVREARAIYTAFTPYPNVWDSQFRAAFVAYLASEIVMPLVADTRIAMALRDQQIKIAMERIKQARITDGNEGWSTTDHMPDWMRIRLQEGNYWDGQGGEGDDEGGSLLGGYDNLSFSNGSAF